MNPMQVIINAFLVLRQRLSVRNVDPVYCRLVNGIGSQRTIGWLWRSPQMVGRPLQTRETFTLSVKNHGREATVQITWIPMAFDQIQGNPSDTRFILWFLHQNPQVRGGSYQSISNFTNGAADWNLVTWDFCLVRCGRYTTPGGQTQWRQPSNHAFDWVADPNRFPVSSAIRDQVLRAMRTPLPNGEPLTIRRIFHQTPSPAHVHVR